jgi:hypothetical protein
MAANCLYATGASQVSPLFYCKVLAANYADRTRILISMLMPIQIRIGIKTIPIFFHADPTPSSTVHMM